MTTTTFECDVADPAIETRFSELLTRYRAPVARLAAAYEPRHVDREDLVQDIWLGLWRALPAFRGECSERTFVYRVAHNRAISHVSRRPPPAAGVDEMPDPPDPGVTAETIVVAQQQRERLLAAIRRLPLIQRETVMLSLEELSHREIADILGSTVSSVAVRLSRARAQLARLLHQGKGERT
jgi:RNA polymerase sigma factor (sigma-70 family)